MMGEARRRCAPVDARVSWRCLRRATTQDRHLKATVGCGSGACEAVPGRPQDPCGSRADDCGAGAGVATLNEIELVVVLAGIMTGGMGSERCCLEPLLSTGPFAHSPPEGLSWDQAQPLPEHLQGVAQLAEIGAASFGAGEWGRLVGLLHDVGKYRPAFQAYLRRKGPGPSHKLAGAAAVQCLPPKTARLVAQVIAGHHGGLTGWYSGRFPLKDRMPEARQHLEDARRGGLPEELLRLPRLETPQGLIRRGSPLEQHVLVELFTRLLFSALVDADFLDTATHFSPESEAARHRHVEGQADIPTLRARLDRYLERFASAPDTVVNRHRRAILANCRSAAERTPGVFSLAVPTGGAKTLASLAFALRHAERNSLRRVVIVVPYTSIIEQNARVYSEALGGENVLEHHGNWEVGDRVVSVSAAAELRRRQELLAENWDVPVVVTTSVQFLESLHANRPARCRKLHRLARSVVVLDEVQSLPVHLLDPTLDTLRLLCSAFNISIVSCTATQPALGTRIDGCGYSRPGLGDLHPIVEDPGPLYRELRRVEVRWPECPRSPTTWEALARELRAEPRVLAVVHRRRDARSLVEALDDPEAFHLSALMLPAHRLQVLDQVRDRLERTDCPCRLVSTQLVEAGVDLDFPVVYRALAGLDSLAQAAGRCNREGLLPELGSFRVFVAPTSPPPGVLERALGVTRTMLAEGPVDLHDPRIFERFYKRLYDSSVTDAAEITGLRQQGDLPGIAEKYRVIPNRGEVPVVIPWAGLGDATLAAIRRLREGRADRSTFREIRRATLEVPRRQVRQWLENGAASASECCPLPVLELEAFPSLYDDRFGLVTEAPVLIPSDDLVL